MSKNDCIKNGGMPAIPPTYEQIKTANSGNYDHTGLTKREQFASIAMQGWLARCSDVPHLIYINPDDVAELAVEFADALLVELEK